MRSQACHRWDTDTMPSAQQFDAWHDILQKVYGAWDVSPPTRPDFSVQMVHRAVGGFQIVDCCCDPCGAKRTRTEIAQDDRETLTIQLVLSGLETFHIDDKRIDLGAGDLLIWNSIRPMSFEVKERLRKISVTMPLARLRSWLPASWHSIESSLPHVAPGAELLSSMIGALSPAFLSGSLRDSEALTESVIGILINVLGIDRISEPTSLRGAQLLAVKEYIKANLADPELSPASIALAKRISLRYLHALFEHEGTTVQQHIIQERLIRCRRELESPLMAGRTITDIAFGWGFQNSTHFSRRFRSAFGATPQEYRTAALDRGKRELILP